MVRQKIIEELNNLSKAEHIYASEKPRQKRSKRPPRLLPKHVLMGKKRGDDDDPSIRKFYGSPTNCSDLSLLGYTLNGYYLVKPVSETLNTLLETIYCAFKQPEEPFLLPAAETRIGRLKFIDGNKSEPLEGISNKYTSIGIFLYISRNISASHKIFFVDYMTEKNVTCGISSPRMGHLVNGFGKCFALDFDDIYNGRFVCQWECFPAGHKGQLWGWNEVSLGSKDKHLCNALGKCASVRFNDSITISPDLFQWDHLEGADGQKFDFFVSLARPGFYLIKNSNGKCISVPEKTNSHGARIHVSDCNASEPGQNWKWNYMY